MIKIQKVFILMSLVAGTVLTISANAQDRRVPIHMLSTQNGLSEQAVKTAKQLATSIGIIESSTLPSGEVLVDNTSLATGFLFSSRCHALLPLHAVSKKKAAKNIYGQTVMVADGNINIIGATVKMTFGYDTPSSPKTTMSGKVIKFGDSTFDFAIVRLDQKAPAHIRIADTAMGTAEEMLQVPLLTIGTPADIYNYHNPATPLIVDPTCRATADAPAFMNSTCLGYGGSSGSPVLARIERDEKTGKEIWSVIGMVVSGGKPREEVLASLNPVERPTGQAEFMNFVSFQKEEYSIIWGNIKRDLDANPCL